MFSRSPRGYNETGLLHWKDKQVISVDNTSKNFKVLRMKRKKSEVVQSFVRARFLEIRKKCSRLSLPTHVHARVCTHAHRV